jgi:hypothetical protein
LGGGEPGAPSPFRIPEFRRLLVMSVAVALGFGLLALAGTRRSLQEALRGGGGAGVVVVGAAAGTLPLASATRTTCVISGWASQ